MFGKTQTFYYTKMTMKIIKGDLFTTNLDIIAHVCNCRGGFGSGVAGQIAKKYPLAKQRYLQLFNDGRPELGTIQFVDCGEKIIANCFGQDKFGYDGKLYADYHAIRLCLNELCWYASEKNLGVAMPKIGCGLAGGDWGVVEPMIREISEFYNIVVEVYYL